MDAVQITNVTKTFGDVTAVDNLSLTVPEGTVYGFIGPNGSGKTTTMRMIASIFYPDSGDVRVFGKRMRGARSELIGYLPEERGLYKKMAVLPMLEFYGELRSGRKVTAEVEAETICGILDSNDIPAMVVGAAQYPVLGFEVKVPRGKVREAEELILEAEEAGPAAAAEGEAESEK